MPRKKLVIVTNLFPNALEPTRGVYIDQLVDRLKDYFDITVVAPVAWRPRFMISKERRLPFLEQRKGTDVFHPRHLVIPKTLRLTYAFFMFLRLYPLLRKLKREGRCDCISAHWIYPDGVAAAMVAGRLRIPVFLHSLGCDINDYTTYFWRRVQIKRAAKSAVAVVTKSRALARSVVKLDVDESKVCVAPNGVDRSKFKPGSKNDARVALGISETQRILLYVGNFNVEKNVGVLIAAFAAASQGRSMPPALYLVGDGPQREYLESLVAKAGIEENVHFLGRRPHEEIAQFYHAADHLGLPSLREGCPNVVLEALASGLPIIASDVGGVPEIVTEEFGVLVPPTDHDAWVAALNKLFDEAPKQVESFDWPSWEDNATEVARIISSGLAR